MLQCALFTATCENKKLHYGPFLLSALLPHLTELIKVFQVGYFNFAQMIFVTIVYQ